MSSKNRGNTPGDALLVKDVVARHRGRQVPIVRQDTPIARLPVAIQFHRHSRQLYVVDGQNHLLGNITLGRLVITFLPAAMDRT